MEDAPAHCHGPANSAPFSGAGLTSVPSPMPGIDVSRGDWSEERYGPWQDKGQRLIRHFGPCSVTAHGDIAEPIIGLEPNQTMEVSVTQLYDPYSNAAREDPYPLYSTLREKHPVYNNPEREFWALSRFDDVLSAARDWRTFSSSEGVEMGRYARFFGPGDIVDRDPPRHDQLRKIVGRRFAPSNVAALEPAIRVQAEVLTNKLAGSSQADLAQDFAMPLPINMISELLGLPRDDQGMVFGWVSTMQDRSPGEDRLSDAAHAAMSSVQAYFKELVDWRKKNGRGDDILGDIAEAARNREVLSDEVPGLCMVLLVAGMETTASLLTNALLLLERHPDQRAGLRELEWRIPSAAIEEFLRFESPVQWLGRVTTREVELHSVTIPAGERVLLLFAAANRDARRFEDPERFDLCRAPDRNLAFGEGIHHCLGAPLARLEARVGLETLLKRIPEYRVNGPVKRYKSHLIRGLASLPVAF